jgi:hypothetical protein
MSNVRLHEDLPCHGCRLPHGCVARQLRSGLRKRSVSKRRFAIWAAQGCRIPSRLWCNDWLQYSNVRYQIRRLACERRRKRPYHRRQGSNTDPVAIRRAHIRQQARFREGLQAGAVGRWHSSRISMKPRMQPNPSIELTSNGLRPSDAAHVKR